MKKFLTTLVACLTLPALAFAAYNSVQLSSGTTIVLTVGGSNLEFTAYDGNVQDVQVDSSSVTFTLAAGSTLSISSAGRRDLGYQKNRAIVSFTCTESASILNVSLAASEPNSETLVVTPATNTCTLPGTSGGGGGGGGGGGAPAPEPTPTPAPTPEVAAVPAPVVAVAAVPAAVVAQPSPVAQLVSPVFNKDLQLGSRSDEVKRLQELLKGAPEIYPEGRVTGYYGALTKAAVLRFQLKYEVIQSDKDQGAGRLGPKTRAKIKVVFETPSAVPAEEATVMQSLQDQIQLLLKQIEELQAKIKAQQGQ